MKSLKKYQEKAVNEVFEYSAKSLKENKKATIIFKAPTGSGKTFMMGKIVEMIKELQNQNLCFVWATIGKGSLHEQTYSSLDKNIYGVRLLDRDFHGGKRYIDEGDIVVLNWEKIRAKNKDGEWTNILMKDKEQSNFRDVIRNTKEEQNRKIILIIDESHSSAKTDVASEIRQNIIDPDLTIEMSATPILQDYDCKIQVEANDVILEEMIKKEVIINLDIDKIEDDELDSSNFILECAFRKLQELKDLYKKLDINLNPLCLIQIPTSDDGDVKRKIAEEFLQQKGISTENRKLAIWLSEEKIHNEKEFLNRNDSEVDFLIFKQAIDTGWDCPRAQILIKFRETKSITFEIQTVGRILRMPEAKHYKNDTLNKAYIYTNIQSIQVKKEEYSPNIIKSCHSKRRDDIYTKTTLKSYYKHRLDFGDITSSVRPILDKTFCDFFNIKVGEYSFFQDNQRKMEANGINFDNLISENDEILLNEILHTQELDLEQAIKLKNGNGFKLKLSEADKTTKFNQIISDNIKGYAFKRSFSVVQNALYNWFIQYLGLQSKENAMPYIQSIVLNNREVFTRLLSRTIEKYEPIRKDEIEKKDNDIENWNDDWEIPQSKNYNEHTYKLEKYSLCLYRPSYLKLNNLERAFIEFLDNNGKQVLWWWQNGSEHMQENFGIQYEKNSESRTFQPDFLVMFKDGKLGIFDTKASDYNEDDNVEKSNALQKYISEENAKGKNLIGGLVIQESGHFRINRKAEYKPYKANSSDWEYFEDII